MNLTQAKKKILEYLTEMKGDLYRQRFNFRQATKEARDHFARLIANRITVKHQLGRTKIDTTDIEEWIHCYEFCRRINDRSYGL